MVKDGRIPTALEEGKVRIAPVTGAVQPGMKKGGMVKKAKAKSRSASSRADGCCMKGKTKGRMC